MKGKKLIMLLILVAFVAAIGIVVVKINSKSLEKNNETSQNTTNNTVSNTTSVSSSDKNSSSTGTIRKNTEKVKADTNNMIKITDNYFIEQTNDVYVNLDEYKGKTITLEGLIYSYDDINGDICYAVVRNTPGCCGNDGLAGLDIRYDKDYPEVGTWVEVIGVIGTEKVYGSDTPVIRVTSITEKEEGTSFVTN